MSADPKTDQQLFLEKHGWGYPQTIAQDGSSRSYARVFKGGADGERSAILMINGQDTIDNFICIAGWLNAIGLKAPEVYEVEGPFALIEDFGSTSMKQAIQSGEAGKRLYTLANEILTSLSVKDCPLELPDYYASPVHEKRRWIIDWYLPTTQTIDDVELIAQDYLHIWEEIERSLPPCPQGFLHIDFHAENLMWMPEREGLKRIGILDFQGAMFGPKPYDLGNLLEDMRFDVPLDLRQTILGQYDEEFQSWYRVLATQFHCRLMGQIIWWDRAQNKPQYRQYLPRLKGYLHEALKDPLLEPLEKFFQVIKLFD